MMIPKSAPLDQQEARKEIVAALTCVTSEEGMPQVSRHYGFRVEITKAVKQKCFNDGTGDTLDAILCAVQTAWTWSQRATNFGIPRECDLLEGWIPDPALLTL